MRKGLQRIVTSLLILLFIGIDVFFPIYFLLLHHYKGKEIISEFHKDQPFVIDDIPCVEKKKDKDFVILNLADVQMCDLEDIFHRNIIHQEIDELIQQTKPDLITLTGDQTWSNENMISLTSLVAWMESYQIPWAPVFGNHDFGNEGHTPVLDALKCCEYYENAKYCLFQRGPSNLGCVGNYLINIKEEGKIVRTLYMLDHGILEDFTQEQMEWLTWACKGIKENNEGISPSSMAFFHKPTTEFFTAWFYGEELSIPNNLKAKQRLKDTEDELYQIGKEYNIQNFVCGHNHWMHFAAKDENNITFTMSLKTGELGGYAEDEDYYGNGATYFTISKEETLIQDYFVSREKYHIGKEEE